MLSKGKTDEIECQWNFYRAKACLRSNAGIIPALRVPPRQTNATLDQSSGRGNRRIVNGSLSGRRERGTAGWVALALLLLHLPLHLHLALAERAGVALLLLPSPSPLALPEGVVLAGWAFPAGLE